MADNNTPITNQGDDSFMSGQQSPQQAPTPPDPVSQLLSQGGTHALSQADGSGIDPFSIARTQAAIQQVQQMQQQSQQQGVHPDPNVRHNRMMGMLSNFLGSLGAGMGAAAEHPGNPGAQIMAAIGGSLGNPYQRMLVEREYQLKMLQAAKEIEQLRAQTAYHQMLGNAGLIRANATEERAQQGQEMLPFKQQQASRFSVVPGAQEFSQQPGQAPQSIASGGGMIQVTPEMARIAQKVGVNMNEMIGQQLPMSMWSSLVKGVGSNTKEVPVAEGTFERNVATGESTRVGSSPQIAAAGVRASYQPQSVLDENGNPITVSAREAIANRMTPAGREPVGLTSSSRSMGEVAQVINQHIPNIDAQIDKMGDKLGAISGRWDEFMTGKVGAGDPDFERLRTNISMLQSGMARTHMGARGGQMFMDRMKALVDSGKMDAATLKAGVDTLGEWAKGYEVFATPNAQQQISGNTPTPPAPKTARTRMTKGAGDEKPVYVKGQLTGYTRDGKTYSRRVQ